MMTRVQWILVASALMFAQALMQGCSSCGDNDRVPKDAGGDGGDDGGGGGGAGFDVKPTTGLRTTERGGQDTFTIALTSKPTADVTIELSSSDDGEGTVSPAQLVFTPSNWEAPQVVTVTGVDDDEKDGAQEYKVVTSGAESDDDDYDGLAVADVSVTNTDNESAGVTVDAPSNLETTEGGDTARFTIVLNSQPSSNVVIGLSSDDTGEGSVAPASLTFTPDDWNAPKEVIVTGEDDDEADGPQEYKIVTAAAASDDDEYDGVEVDDVTLTNVDNDTAGFHVMPAAGLLTDEDGDQATFEVRLNTRPTASVTIQLTTDDGDEISFAPTSLTFTPDNWNGLQEVIVTGLPDDDADGNQSWEIVTGEATSDDDRYAGVNPPNVMGSNVDADSPGVSLNLPEDELETREDGTGTARFTISLRTRPTANVTITLATEDDDEVTIQNSTIVFTPVNWASLQTVDLVGVDDVDEDGDQEFTITVAVDSTDATYDAITLPNIIGTNIDNETPGISLADETDLETRENGQQDSFTVRLDSRPTASVVIGVSSSDPGEVTTSVSSLTFTVDNWNAPQTITLTGQNDDVPDGHQEVRIEFAAAESDDDDYDGMTIEDVAVINRDDDTPGVRVVVPPAGLSTTEDGLTQASFTVALATRPDANVTIPLSSSDTGEVILDQGVLTFTPDNWNAPQTVTLTGQDDLVQDGAQPFRINFGPVDSTDGDYDDMPIAFVSGTNLDDDTAAIRIVNMGGAVQLTTDEDPHPAVGFTVVLTSQPASDVTIPVASLNTAEGTAAPASLVFTPTNWASPQDVFLTGVEDAVADGLQIYVVQVGPATGDPNYAALAAQNVEVRNADNDEPGIVVAPLTRLEVVENGDQDSFTVVLNSQPTATVTIPIASSDTGEATVAPASLTFTTDNWAAPQTVLVTGRSDLAQDGHQDFAVHIGPATSTDGNYGGRTVPDLLGTNLDIDSPAIRVIIPDGGLFTDEGGGQTSFQIVLLNQPTADVTIPIASSDAGEGTAGPASITFTTANWDSPQVITLTGQNDAVEDDDQPYFILVGPAVSTDVAYGGRTVPNVRATNRDDDTAGVILADTAGLSTSEAAGITNTDTFTIVLRSEPVAPVTFNLTSSDTGEGTVSPASVTFTSLNWSSPVTITVTGVQDAVDDGDLVYQIQIGSPTTTDSDYADEFVPNVPVTNVDDDTAGVTVLVGAPLITHEGGGTASLTVRLDSEPTAPVSIPVTTSAPDEALVTGPAGGTLTFDATNWSTPQTVTLTGQEDAVQDGPQPYDVVFGPIASADANYAALVIANQSASNTDNDTAGITVTAPVTLLTGETGTTATFTVVLDSQPTAPVALALISDDTTEATVSPATLTFTVDNWNQAQTVTVTGQNDFVADRDQPFEIEIGPAVSTDGLYDGRTVANRPGLNTDDDVPNVEYSKTSVTTFEFGVIDTFTVRLTSEPVADVTFSVTSTLPAEATAAPAALVFTAANWSTPQTVTVTGVDDATLDGNQAYVIEIGAGASADPDYTFNPPDITGTNVEAALSCNEWHTVHPALPSGVFPLDTDRTGPNPRFNTYCDMTTDGGGFTLLSWSADTTGMPGVPYPGLANCAGLACARGSSVPSGSLNALFDVSTELAQGQSTTTSFQSPYGELGDYEFAGIYAYGAALAGLEVQGAFSGCAGVATGTYHDVVGTAAHEGVAVYLNSGLVRDDAAEFGDFSSDANSYTWSVGARGAYCTLNSASPSSYLGTMDDGQWGPGVTSAAGSYSVWVR